jgi:hypothetical protein
MSDPPVSIDEVQRRPIPVRERIPDGVVVVQRDRVPDSLLGEGFTDVVDVPLERELWSLDADHHPLGHWYLVAQARTYGSDRSQLMQLYVQKLMMTTLPNKFDAAVRAEVDDDHPPQQVGGRER